MSDPGFTNTDQRDLTLTENSNQIDIGAFVAQAVSDGSGRSPFAREAPSFNINAAKNIFRLGHQTLAVGIPVL